MASGGAIVEASVEVIKKAKQAASHVFEAPIQDIEFIMAICLLQEPTEL